LVAVREELHRRGGRKSFCRNISGAERKLDVVSLLLLTLMMMLEVKMRSAEGGQPRKMGR
jgi:hypothetical protein